MRGAVVTWLALTCVMRALRCSGLQKMRLLKQQETTQGKKMMPGMGKKKNNSHKEPSASGGMWGMQMVHKFRVPTAQP